MGAVRSGDGRPRLYVFESRRRLVLLPRRVLMCARMCVGTATDGERRRGRARGKKRWCGGVVADGVAVRRDVLRAVPLCVSCVMSTDYSISWADCWTVVASHKSWATSAIYAVLLRADMSRIKTNHDEQKLPICHGHGSGSGPGYSYQSASFSARLTKPASLVFWFSVCTHSEPVSVLHQPCPQAAGG